MLAYIHYMKKYYILIYHLALIWNWYASYVYIVPDPCVSNCLLNDIRVYNITKTHKNEVTFLQKYFWRKPDLVFMCFRVYSWYDCQYDFLSLSLSLRIIFVNTDYWNAPSMPVAKNE